MSAYLSNLLTQTTSRYNSLRRTLLSSEDDGDTEDDTHVCRVLRAYYTEKGRPYPGWLPPDPNDRKAITPQPYMQQASSYFAGGSGRNAYGPAAAVQQQSQAGQRASLSDLWDSPGAAASSAPMQPTSLRSARRPMNNAPPTSAASLAPPPPQARPLPSQRAGSYQNVQQRPAAEPSPPPGSSGGGTAQDRLKARLWGGARSTSPATSPVASQVGAPNPYDQPAVGAPYSSNSRQGNPYPPGAGDRRYGR